MNLEVNTTSEGLFGGPEVWIKVQSNEVIDWPTVEEHLAEDAQEAIKALGPRRLHYYPHRLTKDERAESGFMFEDYWVWVNIHKAGQWASEDGIA